MKQLRKIKLSKHAEVLDYDQMQHIVGGYATKPEDCPAGEPACYCDNVFKGCYEMNKCITEICKLDLGEGQA